MRGISVSRTLSFYLIREISLYSILGFLALTMILVSQNLVRGLEDLIGVGLTWADFAVAAQSMAIMFMAYAAPISFFLGALLALRRLTSHSEILAMRACGIGLGTLLVPTLSLGVLIASATGYLVNESEHQVRRNLRTLLMTVFARGNILEPGRFRVVGDRVIFVESRGAENDLHGVMISNETDDSSHSYVIFAEHGAFEFDPEIEMIRIQLRDGELHTEPGNDKAAGYKRISFEKLDYNIDVRELLVSAYRPTRPKQMTRAELKAVLDRANRGKFLWDLDEKNPSRYEFELHRRYALPIIPVVFALLAVGLGTFQTRTSRAWAPVVGILVAFAYYGVLSFGGILSERGWMTSVIVLWSTNALFGLVSLEILRRAWRSAR
ncbi:MAG: LptF/LptG family permease [Myxococcota bacterium]